MNDSPRMWLGADRHAALIADARAELERAAARHPMPVVPKPAVWVRTPTEADDTPFTEPAAGEVLA